MGATHQDPCSVTAQCGYDGGPVEGTLFSYRTEYAFREAKCAIHLVEDPSLGEKPERLLDGIDREAGPDRELLRRKKAIHRPRIDARVQAKLLPGSNPQHQRDQRCRTRRLHRGAPHSRTHRLQPLHHGHVGHAERYRFQRAQVGGRGSLKVHRCRCNG
jgi:hypothetical protein